MGRQQKAKHVRGVVGDLLKKWEDGAVKKGTALRDAWMESIDEKVKGHARPISMKRGILLVEVEDSVWLYKLTLEKRKILDRFNEKYTGRIKAKDMRCRVGTLE